MKQTCFLKVSHTLEARGENGKRKSRKKECRSHDIFPVASVVLTRRRVKKVGKIDACVLKVFEAQTDKESKVGDENQGRKS